MIEPDDGTVVDLLMRKAQVATDRPACWSRGTDGIWVPLLWGGVLERVHQLAAAFHTWGVCKGDRLAVLLPTRLEWQIVELAALRVGAVVVGIDPANAPDQIAFILRHSGSTALVTATSEYLTHLPPDFRARMTFVLVLALDPEVGCDEAGTFRSLKDVQTTIPSGPIPSLPLPTDPASLIYTSGTTGTPKAILYTHAQIMVACWIIRRELGLTDEQEGATLCWLPMAHLFQRMANIVAFASGVGVYFVENPRDMPKCLHEVGPLFVIGVPRFFEKLQEGIQGSLAALPTFHQRLAKAALEVGRARSHAERTGQSSSLWLRVRFFVLDRLVLSRLRQQLGGQIKFMLTGSAPIAPNLLEFFHALGILVLEAYGISENAVPIAMNRPNAFRLGSVGRICEGNEVCFAGDGEILVRGPGLFTGYYNDAEGTNVFTEDGFYRTGDNGRLDQDGFLYLFGRKSELIKTSTGRRVSPSKIEAVYRESPYVDQIVVVGDGRKHLVALVTLDPAAVRAAVGWRGVSDLPADDPSLSPRVRSLVDEDLRRRGRLLPRHEQVEQFAILPRPLSVGDGEVTTNLKVRRQVVEARYRRIIEALYAEKSMATVLASGSTRLEDEAPA